MNFTTRAQKDLYAPSTIRTCNPRFRRPILYPIELWALILQHTCRISIYVIYTAHNNPLETLKIINFVALFNKSATKNATNLKIIIKPRLYILIGKNHNNFNFSLPIVVNKFNLATKKPVLSTPTRRTQTLVFFGIYLGCFWERSLRLDTKKHLEQDFLSCYIVSG